MKPLTEAQAAVLALVDEPSHVRWLHEAVQLRQHPNVWHELTQRSTENAAWSFSLAINTGRKAAFRPAGAFESQVRGKTVFVRYVGGSHAERC